VAREFILDLALLVFLTVLTVACTLTETIVRLGHVPFPNIATVITGPLKQFRHKRCTLCKLPLHVFSKVHCNV